MSDTQMTVVQPSGLHFSREQEDMIRGMYAKGATRSEFQVLMEVARSKRLNPLLKQIWFLPLNGQWQAITSIHGMRCVAQRTGERDGERVEYEYEEDGNTLRLARATVYRKGHTHPYIGEAYWCEYNKNQALWKTMKHTMLGKCALAIAYRAAFPEDMAGLYADDEMVASGAMHDASPERDDPTEEMRADYVDLLAQMPEDKRPKIEAWVTDRGESSMAYARAIKTMREQLSKT